MIRISFNSHCLKLGGTPVLHHPTSRAAFLCHSQSLALSLLFFPTYVSLSRIIRAILQDSCLHQGHFFGYSLWIFSRLMGAVSPLAVFVLVSSTVLVVWSSFSPLSYSLLKFSLPSTPQSASQPLILFRLSAFSSNVCLVKQVEWFLLHVILF